MELLQNTPEGTFMVFTKLHSEWWNLLWPIWLGLALSLDAQMLQKGRSLRLTLYSVLVLVGCILTVYITGHAIMVAGVNTGWRPSFLGIVMMLFLIAISAASQGSGRAAEAFIKFLDPIMFERGDARDLKRGLRESGAVAHFVKRGKIAQALKICEAMYEQGHMNHSTLEMMREYLNEEAAKRQKGNQSSHTGRSQSKLELGGLSSSDENSDPLAIAHARIKNQAQRPGVLLVNDENLDQMVAERRLGQADASFQDRIKATPEDLGLHRRYLKFLVVDCRNFLGADKLLRRIHSSKHFTTDEVAETAKQVQKWKESLNHITPVAP
jgi:hypothetical protein